jgi:hypothetical protein
MCKATEQCETRELSAVNTLQGLQWTQLCLQVVEIEVSDVGTLAAQVHGRVLAPQRKDVISRA